MSRVARASAVSCALALFIACAGESKRGLTEQRDAGTEPVEAGTGDPEAGAGMPDAEAGANDDPAGTKCLDSRGYTHTIERLDLCDGLPHCADGTDEADSVCEFGVGYHCHGTEIRIARRSVCDQIVDCPEGDDEPCFKTPPACPPQAPIVEAWLGGHDVCELKSLGRASIDDIHYYYTCPSGEGIAPSSLCDGKRDCADGWDEEGCPVRCPEWVCDADGKSCTRSGLCDFICADGSSLGMDDVCNGALDCAGGEDEPCVDRFECSFDVGSSVDFSRICDGVEDCWKGQDEEACPHPPSHTYFICNDGEEILFPYFSLGCFKPRLPNEPVCSDGSAPYLPCPVR